MPPTLPPPGAFSPSPPAGASLAAFGRWVRRCRRAQRSPLAALGAPPFSPAYLRALERGQVRPSPTAWGILAARLGAPPPASDVAALPLPDRPDLAAVAEDLAIQLDQLKTWVAAQQPASVPALLAEITVQATPYAAQLAPPLRYRFHRLRALAAILLGQPAAALPDLKQALTLTAALGDAQEVARTHNALGAAYYALEQPRTALHHHRHCLAAIQAGAVRDLTLRLSIYTNLANEYWAIYDLPQALAFYHEAQILLQDLAAPAREAAVCWGLSLAYRATDDLERAILYAARALELYQSGGQTEATAFMQVNLAELLREGARYPEATELLEQARHALMTAGHPVLLCRVYEQYARLELARGDLDQAAQYATAGLVESARATTGDVQETHTQRTQARLHWVAGLVAARRGNTAQADVQFQQALQVLTVADGWDEVYMEVALSYAEMLEDRGAYQQAARHYRAAALARPRRPVGV